jgi:hypothetical protein
MAVMIFEGIVVARNQNRSIMQTCERIVRSTKDYVPIEGPEDIED